MTVLWLRLQAPFAAFRWMQAGVYRATSPVIPPSAAWGLVLNLAGVETRGPLDRVTTPIRDGVPRLRIAVGATATARDQRRGWPWRDPADATEPDRGVLYQQLHSYPVGNSGKELAAKTHGSKFWIAPAKREVLVGFDAVLGVQGNDSVLDRVAAGVRGELRDDRYGVPFAGDNNLLFDRIDALAEPPPARWYERLVDDSPPRRGSCRLTVTIDRADASRTTTVVFAPSDVSAGPPDTAWTWVPGD